jgi:hypothetical protein
MRKFTLILVGIILTFTSCSSEIIDSPEVTEQTLSFELNTKNEFIIEPNRLNPFDYIGKEHNSIVATLLGNYSYSADTAIMESQAFENLSTVFSELYPNTPLNQDDLSYVNPDDYQDIFTNEVILEYIEICSNINFNKSTDRTQRVLLNIENQFILEKGGDFEQFYIVSAVLRYSALKNMHDLNLPIVDGDDPLPRIRKGWRIALADAIGAGRALLNGGGLLGTLAGAVLNSVIEAL